MKLWLVRHAQTLVAPGICYGALDVPANAHATRVTARELASALPDGAQLISSPLQRCEQLAHILQGLRPDLLCRVDARLAEMDFGRWEGKRWDDIDRAELDGWTQSFSTWRCGGAESVHIFMDRVGTVWDETRALDRSTVWITHAGVIRAVTILMQGQRQMHEAHHWPREAPGWGQWSVHDV